MTLEEKRKKLSEMQKLQSKKYGEKNTIRVATDLNKTEFYSTGILGMDLALGGGMPVGRLISISGTESSCKTTTALTAIAKLMKEDANAMCYIYDAENALSLEYAESLGVDLSRLVVDDTQVAEEGLTKLRDAIDSGLFSIAVLDSTNALSVAKDSEGEISSVSMGGRARLLSSAYPQLVGKCAKTGCTLIVIEQIRKAIGVLFGNPEINTVGESGKFFMSQRIMMRRQTKITEEDGVAISNEVKCKVVKNKVAPPYRTCDLVCVYGKGFDTVTDTVNLAIQLEVLTDKGHYYKRGTDEEMNWKSKDKCIEYMKENPDFFEKIEKETFEKYKSSDKMSVMQDTDLTDKINAEKEKIEDLKVTSKDNTLIEEESDLD